jgi:hypothetical protein
MLNAHPRIYLTHETSFYLANRLCPARATGTEFLEYYFRTSWFRWLRLDPRRVIARLSSALSREAVGTAFAAIMQEKAAQYGRPRSATRRLHTPLACATSSPTSLMLG